METTKPKRNGLKPFVRDLEHRLSLLTDGLKGVATPWLERARRVPT